MDLSKKDCENAEIFWWKLYNRYNMYKRTRQECLNPEKYLPANVIKMPFIKKFLGTCKYKLNTGEALLKIEQLKEAADRALPDVLEKCNCQRKDYRITNKLKARLIELTGLFYLKSYQLISKKDFIKLYTDYSKKYYGSRASKKKYTKKDLHQISSKILTTVFQKNIEKNINNVVTPVDNQFLANTRRTSARNTRRTSTRNTRRTSTRNTRRTSTRNTRRTSTRNTRRTSTRNTRRTSTRNTRRTSARNTRRTKK